MTPIQFRAALVHLGLSQLEAATLFRVDPRTVRRWILGERSVPPPMVLLVRLMLASKITVEDIETV